MFFRACVVVVVTSGTSPLTAKLLYGSDAYKAAPSDSPHS